MVPMVPLVHVYKCYIIYLKNDLKYKHSGTYSSTMVQALVRVQAHMLARIVVEIRAADIAVELEP